MKINLIVVHCSDTPDDRDVDAEEIHGWHLENGWDGIGYHHVIKRDGTLENGRPHYWVGSHAKGSNIGSLGVCMVGRDVFTDNQYKTLEIILTQLMAKYGIDHNSVYGHTEIDHHKSCPNAEIMMWLYGYRTKMIGED